MQGLGAIRKSIQGPGSHLKIDTGPGAIQTSIQGLEAVRALSETVFRITRDVVPLLNVNFLVDNNRQIDITNYNN